MRRLDPILTGPLRLAYMAASAAAKSSEAVLAGGIAATPKLAVTVIGVPSTARTIRPAKRHPDPLCHLGTAREIGPGQDEDELLPAPASSEVDVPDGLLQKHGELAQDAVAARDGRGGR